MHAWYNVEHKCNIAHTACVSRVYAARHFTSIALAAPTQVWHMAWLTHAHTHTLTQFTCTHVPYTPRNAIRFFASLSVIVHIQIGHACAAHTNKRKIIYVWMTPLGTSSTYTDIIYKLKNTACTSMCYHELCFAFCPSCILCLAGCLHCATTNEVIRNGCWIRETTNKKKRKLNSNNVNKSVCGVAV